jgi:potassium uptake TrkH family protein
MNKDWINRIRERINVRLFSHKRIVLNTLKVVSILVSLFTLGIIIHFYGFPGNEHRISKIINIVTFSIGFYLFKYFTQIFYDFHPLEFIKRNLAEGIILAVMLILVLFYYFFGVSLLGYFSVKLNFDLQPYVLLSIQLYFLLIVGFEVGKASQLLKFLTLGPSALMTLSFLLLIFFGTGLLMLPEMTYGNIRFIDALFTSASASCVTGLTVVDTGTFFTFKGQIVILLLFQFGGINIVSFATFFATFHRSDSVRYQSVLRDFLSTGKISDTRSLLRKIIYFSLVIEMIGSLLIYLTWSPQVIFKTGFEKVYFSVFHCISAFNNAGFSLFPKNLYDHGIATSFNVHVVFMVLIFLGGIGFTTLENFYIILTDPKKWLSLWKHLKIGSKIAIKTSIWLIIAGAVLFLFAEWDGVLSGQVFSGQIITSLFQSVTTRTAGFNTVDIGALTQPVLIFFIFLMFIGASPGSTGGGIKTTTFSVILRTSIATIRGKKNVEAYHHTFSFSLIDRAYAIALFAIFLIFSSTLLLSFTEPYVPFLKLIFEEVSAFGTVGLSTGITPFLSDAGKVIITLSMFIGRIGPLTLAVFLSKRIISTKYRYPDVNIMVG